MHSPMLHSPPTCERHGPSGSGAHRDVSCHAVSPLRESPRLPGLALAVCMKHVILYSPRLSTGLIRREVASPLEPTSAPRSGWCGVERVLTRHRRPRDTHRDRGMRRTGTCSYRAADPLLVPFLPALFLHVLYPLYHAFHHPQSTRPRSGAISRSRETWTQSGYLLSHAHDRR